MKLCQMCKKIEITKKEAQEREVRIDDMKCTVTIDVCPACAAKIDFWKKEVTPMERKKKKEKYVP